MLSGEQVAVSPHAVYCYQVRSDSLTAGQLSAAKIAGCLRNFEGLHALLYRHQTQLPAADLGVQYNGLVYRCMGWAERAEHPEDAAACRELAERIIRECPVPQDMQRAREAQQRAEMQRAALLRPQAAADAPAASAAR